MSTHLEQHLGVFHVQDEGVEEEEQAVVDRVILRGGDERDQVRSIEEGAELLVVPRVEQAHRFEAHRLHLEVVLAQHAVVQGLEEGLGQVQVHRPGLLRLLEQETQVVLPDAQLRLEGGIAYAKLGMVPTVAASADARLRRHRREARFLFLRLARATAARRGALLHCRAARVRRVFAPTDLRLAVDVAQLRLHRCAQLRARVAVPEQLRARVIAQHHVEENRRVFLRGGRGWWWRGGVGGGGRKK